VKKYLINNFDLANYVEVADELPLWSAPFGLKLLGFIDYKPGITVLDIGFGSGFPLTEIALRLGDTAVIYGIDPWKEAIERVNKKIHYYGISNIRIIGGVAESIPLENDSVDLITSNNGINNVQDCDKVISECSRIMKRGGQMVLTMNTDKTMIEFYGQLERVLSDLHMDKEIDLMRRHISHKRPPVGSIVSMLQNHGFTIKDREHDQFSYSFANGTALLNHYFIRLAFMDSWIRLLPPDKVEQVFDIVETYLNEVAELKGNLNLSIPFVIINAIKK
jgi:arsenite methyltransferase